MTAAPRMRALLAGGLIGAALMGCAGPEKGPWPVLVPLDDVLSAPEAEPVDPAPALDARGAALRARADRLRRLDP
ncbi:hypothetical protein [Phaeovulum vinaykumarii]|nr:hypothetical protein [Phaeovulum vinaykumarii]